MTKSTFHGAITLGIALLCSGAVTQAQQAAPPTRVEVARPVLSASITNSMAALDDSRTLSPGDQVSYRVLEEEEPARVLIVTDSGEMEVPLIGRLQASGKTCQKFAHELKSLLEENYFHEATVILGVDVIGQRTTSLGKVYVMGQVRSQGPMMIPSDETFTVSKAILRAGGFGDYANRRKVKLLRRTSNGGESDAIIVDLVEVIEKGRTDLDPVVVSDDLIVVPERMLNF